MNRMMGKSMLLAALGGLLLAFSFPKLNISFLSCFSVTLLLIALQDVKGRRDSFLLGFLWGLVFFAGLLYWVAGTVHTFGKLPLLVAILVYLLLVVYLSLYSGLFALAASHVKEKMEPFCLGNKLLYLFFLPAFWVLLEQIRGNFPFGGFPWGEIGYAWVGQLEWVQLAEFTSVSGVSFLVVFVNVLLFLGIAPLLQKGASRRKEGFAFLAVALAVLMGNHFIGGVLMQKEASRPVEGNVKVALLQGNIPQDVKWNKTFRDDTLKTYFRLQAEGAAKGAKLVVWPETSVPLFLLKHPDFLEVFHEEADMRDIHLIVGTPDYIEEGNSRNYPITNTALFFRPGERVLERFDKTHLVPFGEYVPLQEWLPFISKLVEEVGNFAVGKGPTLFQADGYSTLPLICFEVIFSGEVRRGVQEGANLITHLTNDAWFGDSSAPPQHVEIVQMRGIENRVPAITAANTGVTNVILATGEVAAKTELLTKTVLVEEVSLRPFNQTFYNRNGNIMLYLSLLISAITAAICFKRQ